MAGYGGNFDFSSPPPPPDYDTTTPPPPSSASASASSSASASASSSSASAAASSSSSSASTSASSSTSSNTKLAAGIGVGIGIPVLLIAVAFFVIWFKRKRRHASPASSDSLPKSQQQYWQQNASPPTRDTIPLMVQKPASVDSSFGPASQQQYWQQNASRSTRDTNPMLQRPVSVGNGFGSKTTFTYEELAKATKDFSESNFLGQGGFGYVYKGVLPNGKEVAIKMLKFGSQQGDPEFRAEIDTISRIHHRHLVSLTGHCIYGTQRLLVYQFVPNKTLKFHLHDKDKDSPPLKWEMRMKIALGSAKGLTYLHEDCDPKIIHRDIKSANILLDYSFEAKVADFGLARFNSDTQTHLSIAAAGTKGYIAPECSNERITEKSDVYSFGVVLLELITGRQPTGEEARHIVGWAKPLLTKALKDKNFDNLADPRLQKYNSDEMARMVTCAAACVSDSAQDRPRMSQIVRDLEVNVSLADLSEGIRPGHSTIYESLDNVKAEEDSKIFRNMAPGSQEHGANGGSVTNPSGSDFFQ